MKRYLVVVNRLQYYRIPELNNKRKKHWVKRQNFCFFDFDEKSDAEFFVSALSDMYLDYVFYDTKTKEIIYQTGSTY